jgi:hypothetical protein
LYLSINCYPVPQSARCPIKDVIYIANNSITRNGYILDPTVQFERGKGQAEEVDTEKKEIYNQTIPYYKDKYNIKGLEVIGLLVGARGTIT